MLTDYFSKDLVALDIKARTPEEAIRRTGDLLVRAEKASPEYVDAMVGAYDELGPYIVVAPHVALPHSRPGDYVLEPCVAYARLAEPIAFGHSENDPVVHLFALGGREGSSHIELLHDLAVFLSDETRIKRLETLKTYHAFLNLLDGGRRNEMKELRVLSVCGMGFGTSLMTLMNVQELGEKYDCKVVGEACDLGSWQGKDADVIVASSEIAAQITGTDIPVVSITNILNKGELEEKIRPYFSDGIMGG